MRKRINPRLRFLLAFIILIITAFTLTIGGYAIYIISTFYRIEDNIDIDIINNNNDVVPSNHELTITTFNIGFGAYEHSFSFFMDDGEMLDGTIVKGQYAKARNLDVVVLNTVGCISYAQSESADFYFFQEVDERATRSHKYNQLNKLKDSFSTFNISYAENFHSAYLFYPFNDPIGKSNSGIVTLSKYNVESSTRRQFPIDMSFVNKFFDLDRCFMISRLPVDNDKELVLINLHMSAYDEGGAIRASQLELLNTILAEEYNKGNYVIAGGDWNHDIANSINTFTTTQKVPNWVYALEDEDLVDNYSFVKADNAPTCRSTDIAYTKNVNYTVVIDGFAVSDNVTVISAHNVDANFKYSDHNPATLKFMLAE